MIIIEIKERSRTKEIIHSFSSKAEDLLFDIVQRISDKLIPKPLMNWLERYTDKRLAQLQHEIIRQQWTQIELEKAVSHIQQIQQDTKKAPTDD